MKHEIPAKALTELRDLVTARNSMQQRCSDYSRAIAVMLGVDPDAPGLSLDLAGGAFVTTDPPKPAEPQPDPTPPAV